jgi:prepilin-type N-terminal cleavage/methylation domain-containing protein/prepilin-type processing-associated H-X9-DG protein
MNQFTSNTNRSKSNKIIGFTLVELLIVISIIVLLLAILIPALSMARINARRIGCQSNLKQLALCWGMYLDDYDGDFYQGVNANVNYGGWRGLTNWWPRPLNSYVANNPNELTESNAKVFCCPADKGGIPGIFVQEKAYHAIGTSYQTNLFLIGQDRVNTNTNEKTTVLYQEINSRLLNLNLSRVSSNPSTLLLMGDYGWIDQWKFNKKDLTQWHSKEFKYNLAFLDGHVGFLNIRKDYFVTNEYSVLPFQELYSLAQEVQGPVE